MKILALTFLLILAFLINAAAQDPKLPAGYKILEDASGNPAMLRYDFDSDGRQDIFCAIQPQTGDDAKLMAVLKSGKSVSYSQALSMCCGSLSQKNGVIDVHSKGMRGFTYYKFRWDAKAKDFRLIGYDTESFGNAVHDGSGKSSLNLITGAYEAAFNVWDEKKQKLVALPKVNRKLNLGRRIYLKQFGEDADSWLAQLNASNLPKELR